MSDDEERAAIPTLVAVDFTADELRLVLTTPDQQVIANERWPLPPLDDESAWAWEVGGRISTLFARDGEPLFALGISVACPGLVDPTRGVITESRAQEAWDDLHVVDAIRRHIDAPTVAIDRVQAALRGEMTLGAAAGQTDVLYVSTRSGDPAAAVLAAGTIVRGAHHRPGLLPPGDDDGTIDIETIAGWAADAAALLDTAVIVVDASEADAEGLATAIAHAAVETGALAEVVISELGANAPLYGALDAAAIVAYEGEREE